MIKKQNGMSHLIDTEPVRGNRKRDREEEGAKGRRGDKMQRKKKVFFSMCWYVHMTECINACACAHILCVCPHEGPAEKLEIV